MNYSCGNCSQVGGCSGPKDCLFDGEPDDLVVTELVEAS